MDDIIIEDDTTQEIIEDLALPDEGERLELQKMKHQLEFQSEDRRMGIFWQFTVDLINKGKDFFSDTLRPYLNTQYSKFKSVINNKKKEKFDSD